MDLTTFNRLEPGHQVTVSKSGKTYVVQTVETLEQIRATRARNLADPEACRWQVNDQAFEEWAAEVCKDGRNRVSFRQLRENSKGQVVEYGPTTNLKPESIELLQFVAPWG